jgi:hypothetical protein
VAAFLSLQPSWVMILESTLTRKPPSNQTLIVSRFSRLATSELLRRSDPEELIPLLLYLRFASALFHPQNVLSSFEERGDPYSRNIPREDRFSQALANDGPRTIREHDAPCL